MEQLTDDDSPPFPYQNNPHRIDIPIQPNCPIVQFDEPVPPELEQEKESSSNNLIQNTPVVSNGRILNSTNNDSSNCLSGYSVENYITYCANSALFWNEKDLFLSQRQMLIDVGQKFPDSFVINNMGPTNYAIGLALHSASKRASNRFIIFKQPDPVQRRSYSKEKRFLTPKPIVICATEALESSTSNNLPVIMEGTVSVELGK
mmetsp:Transcript_8327/g.11473  ORF Transcript_8327/g.11473 Transcript_8327/m.11473 type:complete len:204 (+) Transcript_8327:168-779(+)